MQEQQPTRRLPVSLVAGITAVIVLAGGGTAWWMSNANQSSVNPGVNPTTTQPKSTNQAQQPAANQKVQVYWLKDTGTRFTVVSSSISLNTANNPEQVLEGAFNQLLTGSNDPALISTIPSGTKLRSVDVRSDGVHVDLSKEFTTGGGSASMSGRLAQVLYTASSLNPNAPVWVNVDGKKLEVLGGEGIEVEQPLTRKNFEASFQL